MEKKLTKADFPDEPHLNATDIEYRQAQANAQSATEIQQATDTTHA